MNGHFVILSLYNAHDSCCSFNFLIHLSSGLIYTLFVDKQYKLSWPYPWDFNFFFAQESLLDRGRKMGQKKNPFKMFNLKRSSTIFLFPKAHKPKPKTCQNSRGGITLSWKKKKRERRGKEFPLQRSSANEPPWTSRRRLARERERGRDRKRKRGNGESQLQLVLLRADFSANCKEIGGDLHTSEHISLSSFVLSFGSRFHSWP